MRFTWPEGATPIDSDEAAGLRQRWITTQADLDAAEQENVLKAQAWLASRRKLEVLSEQFLRRLHVKMFGEVWKWAGSFRGTDKNIGAPWETIPVRLRQLIDDARYWCEHQSYAWDEIGARFHHRLVTIHCFVNGNGRHARLAADALMRMHGQQPLSWGASSLSAPGAVRTRYMEALRLADQHDYTALLAFVRS